jgi:hypothetical protein
VNQTLNPEALTDQSPDGTLRLSFRRGSPANQSSMTHQLWSFDGAAKSLWNF